jgi:hypothetical protein
MEANGAAPDLGSKKIKQQAETIFSCRLCPRDNRELQTQSSLIYRRRKKSRTDILFFSFLLQKQGNNRVAECKNMQKMTAAENHEIYQKLIQTKNFICSL